MNSKALQGLIDDFVEVANKYNEAYDLYNDSEEKMYEAQEELDEYVEEMWNKFDDEEEDDSLVSEERCKCCGQVTKEVRVIRKGKDKRYEERRKKFEAVIAEGSKVFESKIKLMEKQFEEADDKMNELAELINEMESDIDEALQGLFPDDVSVSVNFTQHIT